MQHIKKKPTQFFLTIHCFCSRRFLWLGKGIRQDGPGGRSCIEGNWAQSACARKLPRTSTPENPEASLGLWRLSSGRLHFRWGWLRQALGSRTQGSSHLVDKNRGAVTWLTSSHISISFHLARSTGSNPATASETSVQPFQNTCTRGCLGNSLFKRSGWRPVICILKTPQIILMCSQSWEETLLERLRAGSSKCYIFYFMKSFFQDDVCEGFQKEHST